MLYIFQVDIDIFDANLLYSANVHSVFWIRCHGSLSNVHSMSILDRSLPFSKPVARTLMKSCIRTIVPISSIVSSSTSRRALRALFHTFFLPLLVSREYLIFHDEVLDRSRFKDVIRQKECNRRRRLVSNPRLHPSQCYKACINPQDHGVLAFAKFVVIVRSFTRHEKKV